MCSMSTLTVIIVNDNVSKYLYIMLLKCVCDQILPGTITLLFSFITLGEMTKTFELRIQDECLNPDPKQRPLLGSLLQDRLFR